MTRIKITKNFLKEKAQKPDILVDRKTANRIFINGLTYKQFSNDSRAFPRVNEILHANVSSLPVILASTYRRVVKFLSNVDYMGTTARWLCFIIP